jgi:hypothetical protein
VLDRISVRSTSSGPNSLDIGEGKDEVRQVENMFPTVPDTQKSKDQHDDIAPV